MVTQRRPLPLKIQVDNVEKVELTDKDIGMSVSAAVYPAPETANVGKTSVRARAQYATHRRMLLPQG